MVAALQESVAESKKEGREYLGLEEYQIVTEPLQLIKALDGGVVHIDIRAHLDLTTEEHLRDDGLNTVFYDRDKEIFSSGMALSVQVRYIRYQFTAILKWHEICLASIKRKDRLPTPDLHPVSKHCVEVTHAI